MEYFIQEDGIKQGPFDMIAIIKKIKNGAVNADSLIAVNAVSNPVKASEIEEVAALIEEHAHPNVDGANLNLKISLKACILEGMELWSRRILDYTLLAGLILAIGFGVKMLFDMVIGEAAIAAYFGTVITIFLFCLFFSYVLETKRSQSIDIKEFIAGAKKNMAGFSGLALFTALFILPYAISMEAGLIASLIFIFIITFLIFTPFLAKDAALGVIESARLSVKKIKKIGGDNFGVIFAIVAMNLFVAIIPGIIIPQLLVIGLFISLPVTISALAYIYDQIFV